MKNKLDKMFESDFIRVPRPFIRKFNLNTAVMLSEIYSEYTYWKDRNELQQGGWFYSTVENIYYNTYSPRYYRTIHLAEVHCGLSNMNILNRSQLTSRRCLS